MSKKINSVLILLFIILVVVLTGCINRYVLMHPTNFIKDENTVYQYLNNSKNENNSEDKDTNEKTEILNEIILKLLTPLFSKNALDINVYELLCDKNKTDSMYADIIINAITIDDDELMYDISYFISAATDIPEQNIIITLNKN